MVKKKFYKVFYFKIIPIFVLGFSIGVIAIWPGLISGNSRKCFLNILKDETKAKYVLDFGCGTGNFTEKVINFNPKKIVAVDISEEAIKKAKNIILREQPQVLNVLLNTS